MIIQNTKEKARDWFKRIENMINENHLNVKISSKVILTEVAVYGEMK